MWIGCLIDTVAVGIAQQEGGFLVEARRVCLWISGDRKDEQPNYPGQKRGLEVGEGHSDLSRATGHYSAMRSGVGLSKLNKRRAGYRGRAEASLKEGPPLRVLRWGTVTSFHLERWSIGMADLGLSELRIWGITSWLDYEFYGELLSSPSLLS